MKVHPRPNRSQEKNTYSERLAACAALTFLRLFRQFWRRRQPSARPLIEQTRVTQKPDLPPAPARSLLCPRHLSQARIVPEIGLFWTDLSPPTVRAPIRNDDHSSEQTPRVGMSAAVQVVPTAHTVRLNTFMQTANLTSQKHCCLQTVSQLGRFEHKRRSNGRNHVELGGGNGNCKPMVGTREG